MKNLGAILMIVGYLAMMASTLSGLGYGLYLLGHVGLAFGPAAWAGFLLFIKLFLGGFVTLGIGACFAK